MTHPEARSLATRVIAPGSAAVDALPEKAIGIDVGGTGMKGGIVDLTTGELVGERFRVDTPKPATPQAVAGVVEQILAELRSRDEAPVEDVPPVGVTFPAIVIDNVVLSAANIDPSWIECDAHALLKHLPGRISTLNDADAAGLAEVRYGAGVGQPGTVMMVTLGTGVGTAIVHDGVLVPNSELGHAEFEGVAAEKKVSAAARERADMPWDEYGEVLRRYLAYIWRIQPVHQFIIGGGVSRRSDDFLPYVTGLRADVVPAKLVNNAGIVGAALYAAEQARAADALR
ncbi:polyphosphate--glucose phosphotransferase [Nesterenkonia alba]|uniref:polyphosphate--glucose phosphotransferase n=1 Tax=Nesterenkonia alba TaxID=515814 RepID=UPI0003B4B55B|nr:ROK family protein [Nesterenkonia alba]